ncbi:MAG: MarR family transcriptional regulator [bacterium]
MSDFELGKSLGSLIRRTNVMMRVFINKAFSQNNIDISTERWGILNIVKASPGITQNEIALRCLKDKTNITRLLNVLEKQGHIERRIDENDRRIYNIYITTCGQILLEQLIPLAIGVNKIATKNLTTEEIEQLHKLLNKVQNTLTEELWKL